MTKICLHICSHGTRDRRDTHARTQKWYPTTKFFYRPDGLPAAQPTASKHWKQKKSKYYSNHTSSLSSRIKLERWRKANSDNKLCVLINSSKTRSNAYFHDRLLQNYDVHNISHDSALLSKTTSLHFTTSVVEMEHTCSCSPRNRKAEMTMGQPVTGQVGRQIWVGHGSEIVTHWTINWSS